MMKKKAASCCLLVVVLIVAFVFLYKRGGDIHDVKQTIGSSETYSERDIKDAMRKVLFSFKVRFPGCTMTDLWYDESVNDAAKDIWTKQYNRDESIVLLSNFQVDESGGGIGFIPGQMHTEWEWILVRNSGGSWWLQTWGY